MGDCLQGRLSTVWPSCSLSVYLSVSQGRWTKEFSHCLKDGCFWPSQCLIHFHHFGSSGETERESGRVAQATTPVGISLTYPTRTSTILLL